MKRKDIKIKHKPVMLDEVIFYLDIRKKAHLNNQVRIIDATLGTGGHSRKLVELKAQVLGLDDDPQMLEEAKENIRDKEKIKIINGNFRNIDQKAAENGFLEVDGILMDLGINSLHFKSGRGFSHQNPNEKLDMRINPKVQSLLASDLINSLRLDQLTQVFEVAFDKSMARRISSQIAKDRNQQKIETVSDFLTVLDKCGIKSIKLKSKAMMALRIFVNSELDNLEESLPKAFSLLKKSGRLVVISFHSAEDVIVKDFMNTLAKEGEGSLISKKPILPKESEIKENPRSRSAKLRVIEKI